MSISAQPVDRKLVLFIAAITGRYVDAETLLQQPCSNPAYAILSVRNYWQLTTGN